MDTFKFSNFQTMDANGFYRNSQRSEICIKTNETFIQTQFSAIFLKLNAGILMQEIWRRTKTSYFNKTDIYAKNLKSWLTIFSDRSLH